VGKDGDVEVQEEPDTQQVEPEAALDLDSTVEDRLRLLALDG